MGKSQFRSQEDWVRVFRAKGALWRHDGVSTRPHAKLPSGLHSDGFFNCQPIIDDDVLLRDVVSDLLAMLREDFDIQEVDGVVGPAPGGTKLAEYISDQIMAYKREDCFFVSPTKFVSEKGKVSMVMTAEDTILVNEASVILCDDIYSGHTNIHLTEEAVRNCGGQVLTPVLVLANRSVFFENGGLQIISLIDQSLATWNPDDCPLCQRGSPAVVPKGNWQRLMAC